MRSASTEPLLRLTGVRAGYGAGPVLHEVDLAVDAGSVHAVVGHNGAGKSTVIHVVAGLVRPSGGQIRLAGRDVTGQPAHRRARAGIRLVPQGRRVWSSLTVAEHLSIAYRKVAYRKDAYREPVGDPGAGWTIPRVLDLLPQLAARRRHRGSQLSGGEQQMLAIARALLGQPRLLLLDEPTEGLAPVLAAEIRDLIGELARDGLAILLAAPHPELPAAVAERFTLLTAGRVTATGPADRDRLRAALAPAGVAAAPAGVPARPADPLLPARADRPGWADILPAGSATSRPDRQLTDRRIP